MYFDFFVARGWDFAPATSVQTVYKLYTDLGYVSDHHIIDSDKYILIYTMSGSGVITVGNTRYKAEANNLLIANTSTALRYRCDAQAWNFWLVEFKMDRLPLLTNHLYCVPFRAEYHALFDFMLEGLKANMPQLAAAYLLVLSCKLQEQLTCVEQEDTHLLTRCVAYMENHLNQFSLAQLCKDTGVSARTLNNLFQRTAGAPPYQFYQRLRVERSKEFLETSSGSVAQIAATFGYLNAGHFSRVFKKFFDKTPAQYRTEFRLRGLLTD